MMNVELQNKLAQLDAQQLDALYMRVFNTDDGQLVLEDLRNRASYFMPSYETQHSAIDPYRTHVNEGGRAIVMSIETRLLKKVTQPKDTDSPV